MGTWGYRPQDSDQAHDLNYRVEETTNNTLRELFEETHVGRNAKEQNILTLKSETTKTAGYIVGKTLQNPTTYVLRRLTLLLLLVFALVLLI